MTTLADQFTVPLVDLGDTRSGMEGILVPAAEVGRAPVGVTEQFLEQAASYHERYSSEERFARLVAEALERLHLPQGPLNVLDLGSGSGNSVWPCLELLPQCSVVAVDISPDLLAILRDHAQRQPATRGRVTPVCMSATSNHFASGCFDLVLGAAILHHLLDPGAAIDAVAHSLKPGASAVFFEPMEGGHNLLRLAYAQILEERDDRRRTRRQRRGVEPATTEAFEVLEAMVGELELRTGSDKSDPIYREVDDKWLFTRTGLEDLAARAGFSEVRIDPLSIHPDPFTRHTRAILRLAKDLEPDALPEWAWAHIATFDNAFSPEARLDLLIEACITFTRVA